MKKFRNRYFYMMKTQDDIAQGRDYATGPQCGCDTAKQAMDHARSFFLPGVIVELTAAKYKDLMYGAQGARLKQGTNQ